jgi:uncharacterized repeat protein (TIGR03803 family)
LPRYRRCTRLFVVFAIIASTLTMGATPAAAQGERVLYSSTGPNPQAAVSFNGEGDIFWTANTLVNELTPGLRGEWAYSTPYTSDNNSDPEGTVIFDSAGNLYGVAGPFTRNDGYIFELTPSAGGGWTEQTIYTFPPTGAQGSSPYVGMTFDIDGNLYGTTAYGGAYGSQYSGGTVFELTPEPGGGWKHQILHSFGGGLDGSTPWTSLIFDSAGDLYGATRLGGAYTQGTVFRLTRQPGGGWRANILHSFGKNRDGKSPINNLALDAAGNLYGTTLEGGTHGLGTAFELIPQADGTWSEEVLHNFSGSDGNSPYSGLTRYSSGNLYGTTFLGGAHNAGVVFQLIPQGNGTWAERVLHSFSGMAGDGANPLAGLIFGPSGNLYGTTSAGGANGEGIVYEIAP